MSEAVILSIISLLGTLFGSLGGILVSSKMTNYRIEQLERKQEKYNNLIERTFRLEEKDELHDEKFRTIDRRLEDLEHERKNQ